MNEIVLKQTMYNERNESYFIRLAIDKLTIQLYNIFFKLVTIFLTITC